MFTIHFFLNELFYCLECFSLFQMIISSFFCTAEKSRFGAVSQQYLRLHSASQYTLFAPEVLTPENDYCKNLRVFTSDVESKALVVIINTSRYMKSKQGI